MALPQEFLQELKYQNEIVSVIESYVHLKHSSRNRVGLCPFHSEKSPSFTVFPDSQSYYCFGCGAGGDVITFIKQIENLEYIEAVKLLAQRSGLDMPEDRRLEDGAARLKKRVYEINKAAARFFYDTLKSDKGKQGLDYLINHRKFTPATINHFGLGFAPESWHDCVNYLKSKGFTDNEIIVSGLGASGKNGGLYDVYRKRVMFPIIDLRGNVIGFGGRVLDDSKPKYINTKDTPVYNKSRNLFALNFAKNSKENRIILCEGYVDVIALHQAGFDNAIACLGTALTDEQARMISNYAEEVVTCYDSDAAGQKAAFRAFSIFEKLGIKVKVLSIPDAKDPDEYVKKFGAGRFKLLLDKSQSVTDFILFKIQSKYDLSTPDGKVNFLKESVKVIATLPSPVERDIYIRKLANDLDMSTEALKAQLESAIKSKSRRDALKGERDLTIHVVSGNEKNDPERIKHLREAKCEDEILGALFKHPDRLEWVMSKLSATNFVTSLNRRIFEAVCKKIKEFGHVDLSDFSEDFSNEEMGHMSLILHKAPSLFDEKLMGDYINALIECSKKPDQSKIKQMSDEELNDFVNSLKDKKNRSLKNGG